MTIETHLDTLEAKGLVRLATYAPELEYLFRHWLIHDAAYGSLLKQERRRLHRLVGESLEALYPERSDELAGVLALHFEQAGDRDRATEYLMREGRYALDRNAIREAFSAFHRAADLLPTASAGEDEALRRTRVEVQLGRARSSWSFRPVEEVAADLDSILPIAEGLGDLELLAQIHLHLALILLEGGRKATNPVVQRSLQRLGDLESALGDPSLGALPMALVGLNKAFIGPITDGVRALEAAIPLMERRRDFIGAAFARGWLAIGFAQLGEFDKAERALREAYAQAADGDVIAQLDAQIADAMIRSIRGDLDDALPLAEACVARSEETGATACAVVSAWVVGDIHQRQGRFGEARGALELAMNLAPVTGAYGVWRPTLMAWLGLNSVTLGGSADEAEFDEALAVARQIDNRVGEGGIRWKLAEVRARRGQWTGALEEFEASAAIWEEQGTRPNLARVLRGWGEALRSAGDRQAGDEKLRRALALFEEIGITAEAAAVRDLLEER